MNRVKIMCVIHRYVIKINIMRIAIDDMKKLKIKNWTSCIQDRNEWKLYVEKAKTFKEWSCSAWRRRRRRMCFLLLVKWNRLGGRGMDWSGSEQVQVVGFCNGYNEPPGCIKRGIFWVAGSCQCLKKNILGPNVKSFGRAWNGLIWLRTGTSGGLLLRL